MRGCAGWRFERLSCFSATLRPLLDLHEMTHLSKHAVQHRAWLLLGRAADLAQPERAKRPAVLPALPDLGAHLRDANLGHLALLLAVCRRCRRHGKDFADALAADLRDVLGAPELVEDR